MVLVHWSMLRTRTAAAPSFFARCSFFSLPSIPMPDCTDQSLLPIGTNEPDSDDLHPVMQKYALHLYREAWEDYRAVGCPYGESDDALLVWYSLHGTGDGPALVSGRN